MSSVAARRSPDSSRTRVRSSAVLSQIAAQLRIDGRTYVVLGDAESAEGAVWEAAEIAAKYSLASVCATIDVNCLGQSQPTMLQYEMEIYKARWDAFGWQAIVVDGHDIDAL